MNNFFLSFLFISSLTIQAMQQLPPPTYEQELLPAYNSMVIMEMPPLPEYTEIEVRSSRRCSARLKRNVAFGTTATVLGGLGIYGFIAQGDVTIDIGTFLPFFGALCSLTFGTASAVYIGARERYKEALPLRDCFD
jgi:hypothetical protein